MRLKKIFLIAWILSIFVGVASAEMYRGIGPLDTLSDLKSKFPGASFTKMNPAWAQPHDVMFSITGRGISGNIIIKFYDSRPFWKEMLSHQNNNDNTNWIKRLAEAPDEDITVSWVRWIPDYPFPVVRLVKKYGKPDKEDFNEEDYQPYMQWTKKGLQAYLTDDGKNVMRIDFMFTNEEERNAYKIKFGSIPPWLKEDVIKKK